MPSTLRRLLCVLMAATAATRLPAQDSAAVETRQPDPRLRVFLDCPSGGCERNYMITELPFALWTQDRLDADVHLLITRMGTASGGGQYTYTFIGLKQFATRIDTLVGFVPPNVTDELRRREVARVSKIGLVEYYEEGRRLGITVEDEAQGAAVVAHIEANMKDEHPEVICYAPKNPRRIDLEGR